MTPSPTTSNVLSALRTFLLEALPAGVDVVVAQDNRVPEPQTANFVEMTPLRQTRLRTNVDSSADVKFTGSIAGTAMTVTAVDFGVIEVGATVFGVGVAANTRVVSGPGGVGTYVIAPSQTVGSETLSSGAKTVEQGEQVTVQLDFHSADVTTAGDMAVTVSTLFRDEFATDQFANQSPNYGVVPLYADDPRQLVFVNDQAQYERRWVVEAAMQTNVEVSVPQQYADSAEVQIISVDATSTFTTIDTTAPTLSSPSGAQLAQTTATLGVSTDDATGTLYYVVTTSATPPSAAQVKAGHDDADAAAVYAGSQSISSTGAKTATATGLSVTTYHAYFMHEDVAANQSSVATSSWAQADITAPVLTSPTSSATGSTTADIGVTTDEGNGTLYWVVTTHSSSPSAAQIKAGQDSTGSAADGADNSQSVSGIGAQAVSVTGLTGSTAYYAFFMHEDAATNQSNVPSSTTFTTSFTPASLSPVRWGEVGMGGLFKSNAGSTSAAVNGDVVGFYPDQSGGSFTLTSAADDTTRPTLEGVFGLSWLAPHIRFDGSNDVLRKLTSLGAYAAGAASWFAAVRSNNTLTNKFIMNEGGTGASNPYYSPLCVSSATATVLSAAVDTNAGVVTFANSNALKAAAFNSRDHVIGVVDDGSTITGYLDGVPGTPVAYTRSGVLTIDRFGMGALFRSSAAGAWPGRIYGEVLVNRILDADEIANLTAYLTDLYTVPHVYFGSSSDHIALGNVLDYEYTQAWSVVSSVERPLPLPSIASIIFSNVNGVGAVGSNEPGYELWIETAGKLSVRIINNIGTHYIDVRGGTNICDGKAHTVAASYDGSGAASGVKIYVDGVLETLATVSDTLGGNSIVNANHNFWLGSQPDFTTFFLNGYMRWFEISNIVRDATYMAANVLAPPTPDANSMISFNFLEGTGTTTVDNSGNGRDGTLSSSNLWAA